MDVGHTFYRGHHQGAPPDVVEVPFFGLGQAGELEGWVVVPVGGTPHPYRACIFLKVARPAGWVGLVGWGPWIQKVRGQGSWGLASDFVLFRVILPC